MNASLQLRDNAELQIQNIKNLVKTGGKERERRRNRGGHDQRSDQIGASYEAGGPYHRRRSALGGSNSICFRHLVLGHDGSLSTGHANSPEGHDKLVWKLWY